MRRAGARVPSSSVVWSRREAIASRWLLQKAQLARWLSITTQRDRLSAWSRYACSSSSRMCDIGLMMVLAFVCLDQSAPCAGERRANCSHREAGLLGNLRITHSCIPQQQDLLVSLRERPQGDLHL